MDFQTILTHIANPMGFKKALLNYFKDYGFPISMDKSIAEIVAYHQLAIPLVSQTFFTGTVVSAAGATKNTNLNAFTRNQGEHFLVSRVRLYEGANASLAATAWLPGVVTADVKNGDLDIIVNGVFLERIPVTAFSPSVTPSQNPFAGYYDLKLPFIWAGQQNINIVANFPIAPATANQNLRIELHGVGLTA